MPEPSPLPQRDQRERALARTIGEPALVARVLLARGIDDPDRARAHLQPQLGHLHDPFLFTGMERAVGRVVAALRTREPILVHGDYDVDGISGTVLLTRLLELVEADVRPHIPARADGYSLGPASLAAVQAAGAKLCITVDNGTNACEFVDRIQATGCDVIVTDHHGTTEDVAAAHTILNPRLADAGYPDPDLAGVGVAFTLAAALVQRLSRGSIPPELSGYLAEEALAYVALGTIADVCPLRGQNRVLVHHGLRALACGRNPGLRALLDAGNMGMRAPDAEDVAFRIAPLINAAGRVGHAREAVELLLARDFPRAQAAARVLEERNAARREIEHAMAEQAMALARASDDRVLVLASEHWHAGVVGIVAARVAETLQRPAILLAVDGDRARGSGRSFGMLHLREALGGAAGHLRSWGGHAAAVGLEIDRERIDAFRERVNEVASGMASPPVQRRVDGPAGLDELEPRALRRLEQLAPFGVANPRPTFWAEGPRLVGQPTVDPRGLDLRVRVAHDGAVLPARLKQGAARFEEIRALREPVRMIYSPRLARWAEEGPVELAIWELEPAASGGAVGRAAASPADPSRDPTR